MNRLLARTIRALLGPAALDGITDERLDGITLAIQEEAQRLNLPGWRN